MLLNYKFSSEISGINNDDIRVNVDSTYSDSSSFYLNS